MRHDSTHTIFCASPWPGLPEPLGCDTSDPGFPDRQPLYRTEIEGAPSSGERGNMMISEINFAGSVTDDGEHDPEDIFIELRTSTHDRSMCLDGISSSRARRRLSVRLPDPRHFQAAAAAQ